MTTPVLLILAHPALHRSRANAALAAAAAQVDGVRVHDLYEAYPDYLVDAPREQAMLAETRALVFQHPLYWYSTPGLLKEWFDLMLTQGFAHGQGARALRGKPWLAAITVGGPAGAYGPNGLNRFTIEELLRPMEATAALCGCAWRTPFVVHGGRLLAPPALAAAARSYADALHALAQDAQERER